MERHRGQPVVCDFYGIDSLVDRPVLAAEEPEAPAGRESEGFRAVVLVQVSFGALALFGFGAGLAKGAPGVARLTRECRRQVGVDLPGQAYQAVA